AARSKIFGRLTRIVHRKHDAVAGVPRAVFHLPQPERGPVGKRELCAVVTIVERDVQTHRVTVERLGPRYVFYEIRANVDAAYLYRLRGLHNWPPARVACNVFPG